MKKKIAIDIKRADDELNLVYGEVYAPDIPDSQGDFMDAEGIRLMAHKFVKSLKARKVDVNHDNEPLEASLVESFIAREGDDLFIPGSWVVGIEILDDEVWQKIKSGELNGFSMEASVRLEPKNVTLEIPSVVKGDTLEGSSGETHVHKFTVSFDDSGRFIGGSTDTVNGHKHLILRGTATEVTNKHNHRFDFVTSLVDVNESSAEEFNEG